MFDQSIYITNSLEDLRSGNGTRQAEALLKLVDDEVYEVVPDILPLLNSPETAIRSSAAYALGYLGIDQVKTVGSALMDRLNDPEEIVRSDVIEALGALQYIEAITQIKDKLINDPSALVRASAAEALGELGEPEAIETLEKSLLKLDEDEAVRAYAANSIGLLGSDLILPKLKIYLQYFEKSIKIKAEVLGAIYYLGTKEALQQLIELLDDADENLAIAILNILTDLKDRTNLDQLLQDAPEMESKLTNISQKIPILIAHKQQILTA